MSYPGVSECKNYLLWRNHLVLVLIAHIIVLDDALVQLLLREVEEILLRSL